MREQRMWAQIVGAALCSGSTRRFYDRIAGIYDMAYGRHGLYADAMLEILASHLPDKADGQVVDLACGTGFLARRLVVDGYRTIGVDVSVRSLMVLRENLPEVPAAQADVERLPFADGRVQAVLCLGSWRHFSDPIKSASEIARILNGDGIAIISYFPPAFAGLLHLENSIFRRWLSRLYQRLTRSLGYWDRIDAELENEAMDALQRHFDDVRRVASGASWTAIVARKPIKEHG